MTTVIRTSASWDRSGSRLRIWTAWPKAGVVFELAHTTASHCRPSLNTLLTGLLPFQWNYRLNQLKESEEGFDESFAIDHFQTLPRLLAERGYASFQAGKYWEGDFRSGGFSDGMTRAFDPDVPYREAGLSSSAERPWNPSIASSRTTRISPSSLWFAPMLPHIPHDAPKKYRDLYEGKGLSNSARAYFANCTRYDDVVGQLLNFLAEKDLIRKTLVIYVSDNGWEQDPFAERADPLEAFMGAPKGKLSLHDRGFRTPILFSWPDIIQQRRIPDQLVSTEDLVPTILDYAGISVPASLQGTSLRPIIEGHAVSERRFVIGSVDFLRRDEPMHFTSFEEFGTRSGEMYPPARAFHLRSRDWHYLWYESGHRDELFDLSRDPEEEHDVSADHADRVAGFRAEIEHWKQVVIQPFPVEVH